MRIEISDEARGLNRRLLSRGRFLNNGLFVMRDRRVVCIEVSIVVVGWRWPWYAMGFRYLVDERV